MKNLILDEAYGPHLDVQEVIVPTDDIGTHDPSKKHRRTNDIAKKFWKTDRIDNLEPFRSRLQPAHSARPSILTSNGDIQVVVSNNYRKNSEKKSLTNDQPVNKWWPTGNANPNK